MNTDILIPREVATLKRMRKYWQEVRAQEDQTPLFHEADAVSKILGIRILRIIEDYLDRLKEEKA